MDHHKNRTFTYEKGNKYPNTDTYIDQYDKFPSTDTSNLNLLGYTFVRNSYGITKLLQKYTKGSQYEIIQLNDGNIL